MKNRNNVVVTIEEIREIIDRRSLECQINEGLAVFGSGMVLRTGAAHLSSSERILTGITFKESMGTTGSSVVNFLMKL